MTLEAPDKDVANTVISPKDKYSAKVPDDAISFLPTMVANPLKDLFSLWIWCANFYSVAQLCQSTSQYFAYISRAQNTNPLNTLG